MSRPRLKWFPIVALCTLGGVTVGGCSVHSKPQDPPAPKSPSPQAPPKAPSEAPPEAPPKAPSEVKACAGNVTEPSLSMDAFSYGPGSTLTVRWQAPCYRHRTDWIGLFTRGALNTDYEQWQYVPVGASGSLTFTVPTTSGTYEFRYLPDDGYTSVAVSKPFVVHIPSVCRNLRKGDPYYPEWSRCCDSVDQSSSDWTQSDGSVSGYAGSCGAWGIQP